MGTSAEPQMEGDHRELELRFTNDGTELAGTMFLPKATGRFPAIVWVHASGKHERLGYGPIVKALLGGNMAFFTYDKRGVGESEGNCCPADARDAGIPEFTEQAHDALAALEVVRASAEIDADHVGLLGVSQAGWIVPIAAAESPDVDFTVLASGPTVTTGEENFYSQLTGDADVIDESTRAALSQPTRSARAGRLRPTSVPGEATCARTVAVRNGRRIHPRARERGRSRSSQSPRTRLRLRHVPRSRSRPSRRRPSTTTRGNPNHHRMGAEGESLTRANARWALAPPSPSWRTEHRPSPSPNVQTISRRAVPDRRLRAADLCGYLRTVR